MSSEVVETEVPVAPEPAGSRGVARFNPWTWIVQHTVPTPQADYPPILEPLFTVVRQNHPDTDFALLQRAYETAAFWHAPQLRKSGEPYVTHPLAVAVICAELGMTETTLVAALMHDVVEDTPYTLEQCRDDFGDEVAKLVDGVTKLPSETHGDEAKEATIRKIVMAMVDDIRVVVIKLADRLHNMRTIGVLRPDKQTRIAQQTLDIYAPLAHRLGMNTVKWELEDLSFSTMHPKIYDQLVQQVAAEQPAREVILQEVVAKITHALQSAGIKATVYGRPKHYYSIWQKMVVRGRDFNDIFDLLGLRVLVESNNDCYVAMGVIHETWVPVPGRVKDYIANPKYSTYESIHTTVVGPQGKPVEFQIRTYVMHRNAEYGVAAHWKYKSDPVATRKGITKKGRLNPLDLAWIKAVAQWGHEEADPTMFLDSLMFDLGSTEVMVFTPKSDLFFLPQGSTPVDLAYAVHTQVGHRCIGAEINGRLRRLQTQLKDGDVVRILTSDEPDAGPDHNWLKFVKSPRARQKIRQHFTRERRDEWIERGQELLAKQLRKSGPNFQRLLTLPYLTAVAEDFHLADVPSLYARLGEGKVTPHAVIDRLVAAEGGEEEAADHTAEDRLILDTKRRPEPGRRPNPGIEVDGDSASTWVKLAGCCTPVPGDDIIGFVTHGRGISVHRRDCRNVNHLMTNPDRIVAVRWGSNVQASFRVTVRIEGLDRAGLLADALALLAQSKVSVLNLTSQTQKDRSVRAQMTFEVPDPGFLEHVLGRLRSVRDVTSVERMNV
ncbi:MAG: bifunctional (p)ppGpp synthetase/guanosine-3',5'-bis(diphosphate) 3'-pyrophosphohydrolase [Propionibacteriaceae bacterium]|jgi:GTP pyrophosphokinase|nr:bifunctional (p)ppGpp synthetase/guanosine-3',5'-bis(diphosphate) 3'-pyrophosphohydrolase [Propionibacteriaceae bacterium]